MEYERITKDKDLFLLSKIATEIVKEYYDPILGVEQNDYMIDKFQSVEGLTRQLDDGYIYYLVKDNGTLLGFIGYYPKDDHLYLSKFYLYKQYRGKGYGKEIINKLSADAARRGLIAIELNVNVNNPSIKIYEKMGFKRIRSEKNPIGKDFFMDDYVYRLEV